ncbi:undecaprenyl-diphosphate phosphatase [Aneurinibacillus thermoaerophilus]|uniref:Undecaprenyl-diphosphatase n=1 Tax=Aneurinibacillus thermoaerophilus TaxID=143495 RepID=A0ABX8YCA7_ANETH|nr:MULTISPECIES: undecaprenyl-diphosphate phosphatase [Aneurinibacillus]AMA71613.1 undecaprenyl-diphosphatase [Aneurinibacillus sp. XH2]MED0676821.1 undecaprenyl-diphosphate phosphatase [Aneurinibacillus thermoaerophilus]MED0757594.1 undecaprenyl-diphosphate phosphatase [Aneurinibacillus thermoaerophilus]MED0759233.1 undecaprenyl-diphosphate phosphatase [Aneurinibacillus thermoaerophilus]QYY42628.1 undecaprenyl-diphosphate phosphatase [Aneurinibacillus thermoaerophilus]
MNELQAMILGMIQGLTEFLPISSTGHLYLGRHLFGLDEAGLFLDTMLHIGTLFAVLAVYGDDVVEMLKRPFSRLMGLLLVGTIPAAGAGLLFEDFFEEISRTGVTIGYEFLLTGAILWMAERWKDKEGAPIENITYRDALFIGCFQAAAIMPALSRSGLTIAASLFRGINREASARFSFLLSLPAIGGGVMLQGAKLFSGEGREAIGLSPLLLGALFSAVFGYLAVRWMIGLLKRGSLRPFAIYVWILGLLIIGAQWFGVF